MANFQQVFAASSEKFDQAFAMKDSKFVMDEKLVHAAQALLEPLLLRRTKNSLQLDLPSKTEHHLLVPLSPVQLLHYRALLRRDAGVLSKLVR